MRFSHLAALALIALSGCMSVQHAESNHAATTAIDTATGTLAQSSQSTHDQVSWAGPGLVRAMACSH
jgi:outer membrane lipoprotein-sorting protein